MTKWRFKPPVGPGNIAIGGADGVGFGARPDAGPPTRLRADAHCGWHSRCQGGG